MAASLESSTNVNEWKLKRDPPMFSVAIQIQLSLENRGGGVKKKFATLSSFRAYSEQKRKV